MSDEKKPRKIKYALERDGAKADARQDMDNPFSLNWLALDARHEGDQSRWWALYGTRKNRQVTAVMERDKSDVSNAF